MLYQQGTQRIEVIVRKDGGMGVSGGAGAKETDADKTTGSGGDDEQDVATGAGMSKRTKRIVKSNILHAISVVKQVGMAALDYSVAGIGFRNGDQAHQDQVARKVEIFKDVSGAASSIASGIAMGAWGGPVTAILGGVFGAITSATSISLKYAGRQREYDYTVFKEENAVAYKRARAGIDWTNGRLR